MKGAIMLSGGGSDKLFAAIGVTYPAGSTVTCTNGTKTLKAKTTSGQWVFAIPEAGTWTVTATDGTNTKSQSVSITSEGQLETVTLSYQLVLFDGGIGAENWVGQSDNSGGSYEIGKELEVSSTANNGGGEGKITSSAAVNLSDKKILTVSVSRVFFNEYYNSDYDFDVYIGTTPYGTDVATKEITDPGDVNIDVSQLNGTSYYITLYAQTSQNIAGWPQYGFACKKIIAT